jgi:hypothetical protein
MGTTTSKQCLCRQGKADHRLVLSLAVCAVMTLATAQPVTAGPNAPALSSNPVLAAPYSSQYSFSNLGRAPGVPFEYGAVVFKAGDPNTLLMAGDSDDGGGGIYAIGVTRGTGGHITGFNGTASLFASAPNIDGGLAYGPNGVLFYTAFPDNAIGQIKPGSTSPDKVVDAGALGIASSVGSLTFVPPGSPGAGSLKITSYGGGGFYSATLSPDGTGTYNVTGAMLSASPGGGPDGIAYVPNGSPLFPNPSVLLSQYDLNRVEAFVLDANGNPVDGSGQDFFTGVISPEGAVVDPLTGDFLFANQGFPSDPLYLVQHLAVPEPGGMILAAWAVVGVGAHAWRRRPRGRHSGAACDRK